MWPSFSFMSDSMNLIPLATGSSSGLLPVLMSPVTITPVIPRFCGCGPQLPSSFCDFFRNVAAFDTVACH